MKENIDQPHMFPTQSGKGVSQGLDGVRKAPRERKQERFTTLLHHLNVDLLRNSYALKRQNRSKRFVETAVRGLRNLRNIERPRSQVALSVPEK